MDSESLNAPCIEVVGGGESRKTFSVHEYKSALERARRLGSPAAQDEERLGWARFAPAVEKLSVEQQQPGLFLPRFRICDWDVYDAQMRGLLGLD
jgi:hypothetical protein